MAFGDKDEAVIRSYLLGELSEEDLKAVEQRVLCDEEFSEHVLMIEDSIVEDYIDERLEGGARRSFEKLLLSTPEGEEELRFTRALKEYASMARSIEPVVKPRKPWWQFSPGTLRWALVTALLLLAVVGVVAWRALTPKSGVVLIDSQDASIGNNFPAPEITKGLGAMNKAFQHQRPVDARITVLGYAVRVNTRGNERGISDPLALRQAELTLRDYAEKSPGADSLHALGCLYLAERDLDKAIETLDRALTLNPNSARTHSDLGAAHLEKGKVLQQRDLRGAEKEFSMSLEHINKALELAPFHLEARFNRALLYQQTLRPDLALNDWQEYIKEDDDSRWADEARSYIKAIENRK